MFLGPVGDDPQGVEVKRLGIRPGDRLVLKLDYEPRWDEAEEIQARLASLFEGSGYVPPVIVLGPGAEIGVIGPEGDGEAVRPSKVALEFSGDVDPGEEFVRWLRAYIRKRGGGSVQDVLGGGALCRR